MKIDEITPAVQYIFVTNIKQIIIKIHSMFRFNYIKHFYLFMIDIRLNNGRHYGHVYNIYHSPKHELILTMIRSFSQSRKYLNQTKMLLS